MRLVRLWTKAKRKAFRDVPREVMLMRVRQAQRLGLTYEEYTLEILERGRYLGEADAERIVEIKARRGPAACPPPRDG